jgi:hypothetical protein
LLVRRGGFFFSFFVSQRRRDAKKLWSDWFDFPPRRTSFAALQPGPQNCGAPYFFLLAKPTPEAEQLFRRMVFNVIARNCDDHTKNFAFRLKQNSHWELAPAYDLCHAYKPEHLG